MNAERDTVDDLLARAARGFDRDAEVLTGDDERVLRIERAVQKRYATRPVAARARQLAVAIAVGMSLTGAALAALRVAGVLGEGSPGSAKAVRVLPTLPVSPPSGAAVAPPVVVLPSPSPVSQAQPAVSSAPQPALSLRPSHAPAPNPTPTPTVALPEAAASAPPHFDDAPRDAGATASALFAAANQARVGGNVALAVTLYERLLSEFPRSPEAVSTHLSLGMLRLQQGQAARALTDFEAYEQQGAGAARAEALWGKAQALQRLGRISEERATLSELVEKYPRAAYVAAAQKRLAALP